MQATSGFCFCFFFFSVKNPLIFANPRKLAKHLFTWPEHLWSGWAAGFAPCSSAPTESPAHEPTIFCCCLIPKISITMHIVVGTEFEKHSCYQWCGSDSAFIWVHASGSTFRMRIRIQRYKMKANAEFNQKNVGFFRRKLY